MSAVVPTLPSPVSLRGLRDALAAADLELEVGGVDEARTERGQLIGQLDDYLIPRVEQLEAPLLVVVGGSTGAGKSTLVNAIVGHEVTVAGVLRPTTRAPVLVCHPDDVHWFEDDRILPSLPRVTGSAPEGTSEGRSLRVVATPSVRPGMALLDAPDIDSVVESNRVLAQQLLAAGDLWLFVTTAARYADAVPWAMLRAARERSTALAIVLDRIPGEAAPEIVPHLRSMLAAEGLGDAPLLVIPETDLVDGALPASAVEPVCLWLEELAADADARARVIRSTLSGALLSLRPRAARVVAAIERQELAAHDLERDVDRAYDIAARDVDEALSSGALLRGEVLARWQEFVGTGELLRNLESRVGRLRDRVAAAIRGRPAPDVEVQVAIETSVEALVRDGAERAARRAAAAWEASPEGTDLLASAEELRRASADVDGIATRAVRDWQGELLALVREQGAERRTLARTASYGVNATGVLLMVAIFAHTGGLTGSEVAVAGGTAALSQKVLEAIFGDQAVRRLAEEGRVALRRHIDEVLGAEADRYRSLLADRAPEPGLVDRIEGAVADLAAGS